MGGVDVTFARRLPAIAAITGYLTALAGVYLIAGLGVTLLAGGVVLAAAGLLVDI
jgi:hypothetical protein